MRAPFAPFGRTLQLKIPLLQVIAEAATPVSVKVSLVQVTPVMFVKWCAARGAAERVKVKVSEVTAVQEPDPQPADLLTFRGILVEAALATTAERVTCVGKKFTEPARAIAGMIATASVSTRIRPAFLWVDETLETIEEQSRIDFQVIFLPHANGAPLSALPSPILPAPRSRKRWPALFGA